MKKILVFVNFLDTRSETFISDEIVFLSKQKNVQIDVLHYGRTTQNQRNYGLSFPQSLWRRWKQVPDRLSVMVLKSLAYRNGWNGTLAYLIRFFKQHRYDVIYSHFGTNGKLICELQDLKCIPNSTKIVIRFHGIDMSLQKYPRYFYDIIIKKNVDVIAGSDFAVKNLSGYGFENSHIWKLPVGVQSSNIIVPLELETKPKLFCMVSVGRLVELKGHIQSIMIMNELKKLGIPFKYTIVGNGPLRDELDELIAKFDLFDRVHIMDKMEHSEVLDLLKKSHLYLYPGVVDQAGRQETQGLANIEAMASGLLILASNVGGVSDYINPNETGYLCEAGNIEQFVEKIQWIIEHFMSDEVLRVRRNAADKVRRDYCQEDLNVKLLKLFFTY